MAGELVDTGLVGASAQSHPHRAVVLEHVTAVSGLRSSAPGRVITARSSYITTVSSTKTESGQSGDGGTSTVSQPVARSAAT